MRRYPEWWLQQHNGLATQCNSIQWLNCSNWHQMAHTTHINDVYCACLSDQRCTTSGLRATSSLQHPHGKCLKYKITCLACYSFTALLSHFWACFKLGFQVKTHNIQLDKMCDTISMSCSSSLMIIAVCMGRACCDLKNHGHSACKGCTCTRRC